MVAGSQGCIDRTRTGLVLLLEELLVIFEDIVAFSFILERVSVVIVRGPQVAEEMI